METRVCYITVKLCCISRRAEISIEEMSAFTKDAIRRFKESILAWITMRCLHSENGVEMIGWKIKRLGIPHTKVDSERTVCFTVVRDGFGILVNGGICFWLMIALHKRSATAVPTDAIAVITLTSPASQ